MRVLMTGHNGYIGGVMTPILQAQSIDLVGVDTNFFIDGLFGQKDDNIPTLQKDIRGLSPDDVRGFDAIIHLAALSNDPLGNFSPQLTYDINHLAAVRLATMAKTAGVKRFLYASSCSMYGAGGDGLLTEESPLNPLTPYAISKIRVEDNLRALADDEFSPVFMRNATVYGVSPFLRADIVLNNLVGWAYTTGKVRILSDGSPWRPIVHVQDVSAAFLAALIAPRNFVHNQAFNVGVDGENYQIRDLAEIVRQTVPGCEVEYAGGSADTRNYRVDFSKISRVLGDYYQPQWAAQKGAEELFQAYRDNNLLFEDFQGRKYIRLKQLSYLLDSSLIDTYLRWKN